MNFGDTSHGKEVIMQPFTSICPHLVDDLDVGELGSERSTLPIHCSGSK